MKKLFLVAMLVLLLLGLTGCSSTDYKNAQRLMEAGEYDEALTLFSALDDYEDSKSLATECSYQIALNAYHQEDYDTAISIFIDIVDYKDSAELAKGCIFNKAVRAYEGGYVKEAVEALSNIFDYPEARAKLCQIMMDELGKNYLPEILQCAESLKSYTKTWTTQFMRNYNNTKAGQTIEIPVVDQQDANVLSINHNLEKADAYVTVFNEIFNENVMSRCDDSMRNFIEVFQNSSAVISKHYSNLDLYYQKILLYTSTNQSVSKADYDLNEAYYNMMDAAEVLGGLPS